MNAAAERWSVADVSRWFDDRPWICGCNYIPRTAVNSVAMWQSETFDPDTIDEELGWAAGIGFNAVRIFLHSLPYRMDERGFLDRLGRFLDIAGGHGHYVLPILLDDCSFSGQEPTAGDQGDPLPGTHNSRWVANPGNRMVRNPASWAQVQSYSTAVVSQFADDERILAWDLYNEPGNEWIFVDNQSVRAQADTPLLDHSMALLQVLTQWVRAAGPQQPLTVGSWDRSTPEANLAMSELGDFPSFHCYGSLRSLSRWAEPFLAEGRPQLCTEWLARHFGSVPETHLPWFSENGIGCFSWGLVRGRTQTYLPWPIIDPSEHPEGFWFHDLLDEQGEPFSDDEVEAFQAESPRTDSTG